ncbi:hypothetical protein CM19_05125 [Candidatus Acidianus copahuensis]|uniref:Uncharacterized protein n=2 Tax=Candidatus Acidianus copahuensis TaxID=1160895 RepID=A0A031LQ08_9CREN|nr:hypothetical protein CM19_05125 [Candidatus Acidianus copahuensis]
MLGPSILDYAIAISLSQLLLALPGSIVIFLLYTSLNKLPILILTVLPLPIISGNIATIITLLIKQYSIITVSSQIFSNLVSIFPPVFYSPSLLGIYGSVTKAIFTVDAAGAIRSIMNENVYNWIFYEIILLAYLAITFLITKIISTVSPQ